MAVLVDPPRWPAHGRLWSHLVSDTSLEELHAFARRNRVSPRSFDADHYDVPDALVPDLVAAGAQPVSARELLARLVASGLRVRQKDKPPKTSPDTEPHPPRVAGLLLAGGAPAPVVAERVAALEAGGCAPVLVVLDPGRRADLPASALALVLEHGPSRLSTRLQAGLRAATTLEPGVDAVLVALPDLPPLGAAGIRRVRDEVHGRGVRALARAGYDGAPGHPVLLGREHWSAAAAAASGDRGAGPYLRRAGTPLVECADQLGAVAAGAPTLER